MPQIVRTKQELKSVLKDFKGQGSTIGFVPTMGALHQGHLSLVQMSMKQYDVTVVSIFVNPTQFNNREDLVKYPRNEKEDIVILSEVGCHVIFIPSEEEIYRSSPIVELKFGYLETIMEGQFRPGHFSGVGIIVAKLLGLVQPNGAYFGQKDLQQFRIISTMVNDLEIPVKLHMAPIIREKEGLALSSRNERLTQDQKKLACQLYRSLNEASDDIKSGNDIANVKNRLVEFFNKTDDIKLEYFEIVDFETLKSISVLNEGDRLALCIAGYIAGVRLIDNIVIEV